MRRIERVGDLLDQVDGALRLEPLLPSKQLASLTLSTCHLPLMATSSG